MPRNQSEKGPRLLLNKAVTPAVWMSPCPAQLWKMQDGVYKVRILDESKTWRQVVMPGDEALEVYDAMVDGFYFAHITKRCWEHAT